MVTPSSNYNPLSPKSDKTPDKNKEPSPMENLAQNTFSNPQTADSDLEDRAVKEIDSDSENFNVDEIHEKALDILELVEDEEVVLNFQDAESDIDTDDQSEFNFEDLEMEMPEDELEGDATYSIIEELSETPDNPPPEMIIEINNENDLKLLNFYVILNNLLSKLESHENANVIIDKDNNIFIAAEECTIQMHHLEQIASDRNCNINEFKIYRLNKEQWVTLTSLIQFKNDIFKKNETTITVDNKKENKQQFIEDRTSGSLQSNFKSKTQNKENAMKREKTRKNSFNIEMESDQISSEQKYRKKEVEKKKLEKFRNEERKFLKHEAIKLEEKREFQERLKNKRGQKPPLR